MASERILCRLARLLTPSVDVFASHHKILSFFLFDPMQVHRRISAASLGVLVAVLSIAFYIWSCKQAVSLGYSQSDFSVAKV